MTAKRFEDEIAALWESPLPSEEFERRLALARAELDGEEWANIESLIVWFRRRYPTALDRLRYARRRRLDSAVF